MIENPTPAEYETLLRQDFTTFATRCFYDLNPQTEFAMNWHLEVIAAKLTAVREGKIRRLIINLPPRNLKSIAASALILRALNSEIVLAKSINIAMSAATPTKGTTFAAASAVIRSTASAPLRRARRTTRRRIRSLAS